MRTIKDIDVKGKKILLRDDLNVPLTENGEISDDSKIVESLPTIEYLLENKAKIILLSHLGRPKGREENLKMNQVARRLEELLNIKVTKLDEITGDEVKKVIEKMSENEIVLLENVRFDDRETKNDPVFSKELSELADIYVNDAFGSSHREHSSVYGVTEFLPSYAGFLIEAEYNELNKLLEYPKRPFALLQGGVKISNKIGVVKKLLPKLDILCIGGGMAFTFLRSKGISVGKSLVEEDQVCTAEEILNTGIKNNKEIIVPVDVVVADSITNPQNVMIVNVKEIPDDYIGVDIGPKTINLYKDSIEKCNSILTNGPMGIFENDKFSDGTKELYKFLFHIKANGADVIAAGGDTVSAIKKFDLFSSFTYISTGGGATLEFIEGKELNPIKKLL